MSTLTSTPWPTTMQGIADRVRLLERSRSMTDVIEQLLEIERETRGPRAPGRSTLERRLGRRPDGVACFNYMYLRVSESVRDARTVLEAPDFVERLAVVFAEFYLMAYGASAA